MSRQAFLIFGSQNNGNAFLLAVNIVRVSKTVLLDRINGSYTFEAKYDEETESAIITPSNTTYSRWGILSSVEFECEGI